MLKKSERGDTIIEVLIVLSVLGMAFGIAYATSNRGLQTARNAQEHSAALQFMSGQVEHLRAISAITPAVFENPGDEFCMNPTTGAHVYPRNPAICTSGDPVNYELTIVQTSTPGLFRFDVNWVGVGDLGDQQEQLFYKVHRP